jgi:hypothetical protein
MKHKFHLTGAVAMALMTGCLALVAQAPSVLSSVMKTRSAVPTHRSLAQCPATEECAAVR